jgi:hypothetical protein
MLFDKNPFFFFIQNLIEKENNLSEKVSYGRQTMRRPFSNAMYTLTLQWRNTNCITTRTFSEPEKGESKRWLTGREAAPRLGLEYDTFR